MLIAAVSPALYLVALACPISMGLMMWFMSKGMMGGSSRDQTPKDAAQNEQALTDLKAEQARLAEKIASLEVKDREERPAPALSSNGDEAEQARQTTPS